jgi:hypothetical protein
MEADKLRRQAAAAEQAKKTLRDAEQELELQEYEAKVEQEMPKMRRKVRKAIAAKLPQVDIGSYETYVKIGEFAKVGEEHERAAALRAFAEVIPYLKSRGFKAKVLQSDTRKYVSGSPSGPPGRFRPANYSTPATQVEIHIVRQ